MKCQLIFPIPPILTSYAWQPSWAEIWYLDYTRLFTLKNYCDLPTDNPTNDGFKLVAAVDNGTSVNTDLSGLILSTVTSRAHQITSTFFYSTKYNMCNITLHKDNTAFNCFDTLTMYFHALCVNCDSFGHVYAGWISWIIAFRSIIRLNFPFQITKHYSREKIISKRFLFTRCAKMLNTSLQRSPYD